MNINVSEQDRQLVRDVRRLLLSVLAIPAGPLEHVVQLAHECELAIDDEAPPDPTEIFEEEQVARQWLRMLWHFRCNLDAVMPLEARG